MSQSRSSSEANAVVMGGPFHVIVVGGSAGLAHDVVDYLSYLEQLWSRFLPDSEIMQLNWAEGQAVKVSPETIDMVKRMIEAFNETGGLFDPTTLPLTLRNGYTTSRLNESRVTLLPESARWPGKINEISIDAAKSTIRLPRGTTLDAGGIGKGLAADLGVEFALAQGASGALVSANGDVRVAGDPPEGELWRVGIEHPHDRSAEIDQLSFREGAVVTSSRVHNVWSRDGRELHHLLNPTTGEASVSDVLTASVFCRTAAQGEVLAKLAFMCDVQEAFQFVANAGAQMCIVDKDMKMHRSIGWPGLNL